MIFFMESDERDTTTLQLLPSPHIQSPSSSPQAVEDRGGGAGYTSTTRHLSICLAVGWLEDGMEEEDEKDGRGGGYNKRGRIRKRNEDRGGERKEGEGRKKREEEEDYEEGNEGQKIEGRQLK